LPARRFESHMKLSVITMVSVTCALTILCGVAASQCVPPGVQSFETGTPTTTSECGTSSPGVLPTGWSNDPGGTTVWRLFNGPTPSGETGPQGDHTTGTGNFVYVETSCTAGPFWFGALNAPCFDTSGVQNPTLTFWYHMYGVDMGALSVQQADASGAWSTVHTISGDQGDQWRLAIVPVTPLNDEVQLRFFFVAGAGFRSDCCLDDIAFGEPTAGGNCILPGTETFQGLTPSTATSCGTNPDGELPPLWENEPSNGTDWRVLGGPTPSGGTGPTAGVAGQYVYAEVSGCNNTEASMRTPCWDATGITAPTVEFWYHLYGATAGTLRLEDLRGDGTWATIWSVTGDQGNQWTKAGAIVLPVGGVVRARFRYTSGSSYTGDCALDDVRFGEPTPGDWEINAADAWFDADGFLGSTLAPARISRCAGQAVTLHLRSDRGAVPYDLGMMMSALLPGSMGGSVTAAGQNINVGLANPTLFWVIGGSAPNLSVPFPGDHALVVPVPALPVTISGQMYVLDQSHPDGFVLAQGSQVEVVPGTSLPGPALDEEILTFAPHGIPLCGPATIPFFGTAYSRFHVHSNGRISFGAFPSLDFTASPSEALAGDPFVGFWTDLDPSFGTVFVMAPTSTRIEVAYVAPYFGEHTGSSVSFRIVLDSTTGDVELSGLLMVGANPLTGPLPTAGDRQFLGISPGLGAIDPGPITFTAGGAGTGSTLYDWYDHLGSGPALVPSLQGGTLNRIRFSPNPQGGYDWIGL